MGGPSSGGRKRDAAGRLVAEDAPAFIAPALDLRRVVALVEKGAPEDVEQATAMALSFPIPSRPWRDAPADDPEQTVPGSPYKHGALGEPTRPESPRETLVRSLFSIGPLPHLADAAAERPVTERVLVGRARAIRFRIALHDAWPEEGDLRTRKPKVEPPLAFAIDAVVLVAIADGMPAGDDGRSAHDFPFVQLVAAELRARFPGLTRAALQHAAVTSFARATLLGFTRAARYVRDSAPGISAAERAASLALASRVAQIPALGEHRARALDELRGPSGREAVRV